MAVSGNASSFQGMFVIVALIFAVGLSMANAADLSPTPAPAQAPAPTTTSDGTAIDQGIAYILMLLALVLTYLMH